MARGGTITPRRLRDGSTSWMLQWRVGGRQVKRTVRGSRKDAERALTASLAARDAGQLRRPSTETFGAYAAAWMLAKRPRLELATIDEYETHLRLRLVPTFGKLRLRDVSRTRVDYYVAQARRRWSVKTVNNSLIVLRQVMARAVREGVVATNPAAATSRDDPVALPYEAPTMRHLDRDQAAAYLDAACPEYRPLAELLMRTGMRIGEALALEWRDVDTDTLTLRVSRSRKCDGSSGGTKTDRARTVHVGQSLAGTLDEHRRVTDPRNVLVFATSRGSMLNPSNVRRRWHAPALAAAGLEHVRLHDLRHTAATLAIAAGESVLYVQAQLGHTDLRTTMRYAHADHQAHRAAAARVDAYLG